MTFDIYTLWRPLCRLQFALLIAAYTYLSLTSTPGDHVPVYNDKVMHFLGYLVAGLSITFALPQSPWWRRWLLLVLYSTGIEIAQHFMPPRTFSWLDILANVAGAGTGLILCGLIRHQAPGLSRMVLGEKP